jgi:hypothetical protein
MRKTPAARTRFPLAQSSESIEEDGYIIENE